MASDADTRLVNAVAATLRRHSVKYGAAEAAGDTVVISTGDGMAILAVRRPGPSAQVLVEIDEEELHALREEARKLRAYEAAGIDAWSGHEYAMELYREGEDT